MHKALVLVLTQDTKKGMVPDNAGGGKLPCQLWIPRWVTYMIAWGNMGAALAHFYHSLFRQERGLHCLRHVWPGQVQEPLGALLQGLPGDHLRRGLQRQAQDGRS